MIAATPSQSPSGTDRPSSNRTGDVWAYISASRLNLWARCPLAFKLRYIDGIRSPPSPAMFLGKVVHAALEFHYRHRQVSVQLPKSDVLQFVDDTWEQAAADDDIKFQDSAAESKLLLQAKSLTEAYLEHVSDSDPTPNLVETTIECPLVDPETGEDLGIPLLGVIDLVQDGGAGDMICDFKTASKSSPPHDVLHEVQLTAYSILFRHLSGQRESGLQIRSLIKTKTPKIAFHTYAPRTDVHYRRFFRLVRAYVDDLDKSRFVYRPSFGCGMCDFRDTACSSWSG